MVIVHTYVSLPEGYCHGGTNGNIMELVLF
jgi:hypothetical protein